MSQPYKLCRISMEKYKRNIRNKNLKKENKYQTWIDYEKKS